MPRLISEDILNAPGGQNETIILPARGVVILKQLLSTWIGWDTDNPIEIDELESVLAQTTALRGVNQMTELVGIVSSSANQTITTTTPININTYRAGDNIVNFLGAGVLEMIYTGIHRFELSVRMSPIVANQAMSCFATGVNAFHPRPWVYVETASQSFTLRYVVHQRFTAGQQITFQIFAANATLLAGTSGLIAHVKAE